MYGFKELIPKLLSKLDKSTVLTGVDKVKKKVFSEVKVAVERQVSTVKFHHNSETMSEEKNQNGLCTTY